MATAITRPELQIALRIRCPECWRNLATHYRRELVRCINPRCGQLGAWRPINNAKAPERHAA